MVNQSVLTRALAWLLKHQGPQGDFSEVGSLIHTETQAGLDGAPAALTAFVLIALLEDQSYAVGQVVNTHVLVLQAEKKKITEFRFFCPACRAGTRGTCLWLRGTWRTKCPVEDSVTTACVW